MKEMECSELINDELEALRGIYCGPGEFQLLSECEIEKVFVVKVHTTRGTPIQVTFNLNYDYPLTVPHFSVQVPVLKRSEMYSLESKLRMEAELLKGDPMILSLVSWLTEQVTNLEAEISNSPNERNKAEEVTQTVIINLDHIRNHHIYTKTLRQWCREFSLQGLLLWHNNFIWLLMSGTEGSIKEYLKRHRTCNVDVDASGRPCKERMMNHVGIEEGHQLAGVEVNQLKVLEWKNDHNAQWDAILAVHGLADIYKKWMQPVENSK